MRVTKQVLVLGLGISAMTSALPFSTLFSSRSSNALLDVGGDELQKQMLVTAAKLRHLTAEATDFFYQCEEDGGADGCYEQPWRRGSAGGSNDMQDAMVEVAVEEKNVYDDPDPISREGEL